MGRPAAICRCYAASRCGISSLLAVLLLAVPSAATEIDPVKLALLVDSMASRGSSYDATELHALQTDGLAAVLDHLLPETASVKRAPEALPEESVRTLLEELDADDFGTRERATERLIVKARGNRVAIEQATQNDSVEVRLRAERVLASWESRPASRLSSYLSGFWAYLEQISDSPRLQLLAERTLKAFEPGMPEGDRLHLIRLCIAGVAHGRDESSCDLLRPLVGHPDVRIATLVTETVGAYKTEPRFVPALLVDALKNERAPVVEAAMRFVVGCDHSMRRQQIQAALRHLLDTGPEPLKFQACLPLLRDFQDAEAWAYVVEQAGSTDNSRVRTALNWIGDTKPSSQPPSTALAARLDPLLAQDAARRRAAVLALAKFSGQGTVARLVRQLSDPDETVAREVDACLCGQPDRELVKRLLQEAAATRQDSALQARAKRLLAKLAAVELPAGELPGDKLPVLVGN